MRIIAGSLKGRRILSVPKKLGVRPISGRMRQSLFDILRPKIMCSRFLDLYAGTGAVGLEALSRGAEKVVFIELDPPCVSAIERNLARAGLEGRAQVFKGDASGNLSWIGFRCGGLRFDLAYLGPPYRDAQGRPVRLAQPTLEALVSSGLLEEKAWLVAQHHRKEPVSPPAGWEMFRQSRYGDSLISFFRKCSSL